MIWRPPVPFRWRGPHHLYTGIFFTVFGLFQWYMSIDNLDGLIPLWKVIVGLGIFMIIDDIVEHTWTASTPLRILWIKCILPFIS